MLPGTKVSKSDFIPFNKTMTVAVYESPTTLRIREHSAVSEFFTLNRNQGFSRIERRLVEQTIKAFVDVSLEAKRLAEHLEDYAARIAVAKTMAWGREQQAKTIAAVLEVFTNWSTQTYEGERVSAGVLIDPLLTQPNSETLCFFNLSKDDFFKALTDGVNSWWNIDAVGNVKNFSLTDYSSSLAESVRERPTFPLRYEGISVASIGGCVGVALNRNGEILVFQGGLTFAKRRGKWVYFGHDPIIRQMSTGVGSGSDLRKAIYESCLDASFARSGACIGLLRKPYMSQFLNSKIVAPADLFTSSSSSKAKLAKQIVRGRRFQSIPRTIRKELLGLDGAIILSPTGEVLAAGAILELDGVERGNLGGRSAAAKALSRFGLGIKVSEDGMISCYKPETGQSHPCFVVG